MESGSRTPFPLLMLHNSAHLCHVWAFAGATSLPCIPDRQTFLFINKISQTINICCIRTGYKRQFRLFCSINNKSTFTSVKKSIIPSLIEIPWRCVAQLTSVINEASGAIVPFERISGLLLQFADEYIMKTDFLSYIGLH